LADPLSRDAITTRLPGDAVIQDHKRLMGLSPGDAEARQVPVPVTEVPPGLPALGIDRLAEPAAKLAAID